jgi:ketosteroid isomerase-like protein
MSEEATSPNLVEVTRHSFASAYRHDWDAVMGYFARDAVWDVRELRTFEGPAAIRGFVEDWIGAYDELEMGIKEVRDLGNGVVFATVRQDGRLAGSTARLRVHYAAVYVWEDGAIVQITSYNDIDRARADAVQLAESRR